MESRDDYAILSAVWILACNDEIPLMTYRGLEYRLGLPTDNELEKLIRRHAELFRPSLPKARLELWKTEMRTGKRVPAFIKELISPSDQLKAINSLGPEDGFRSQFRAASDAPRSEVAIIEWGLLHIERLRKANADAREANAKSWQMWLVFGVSVAGVIATVVAAILKR